MDKCTSEDGALLVVAALLVWIRDALLVPLLLHTLLDLFLLLKFLFHFGLDSALLVGEGSALGIAAIVKFIH